MPGYDNWKTRSPDDDLEGDEPPSREQEEADWQDQQQQKESDMNFHQICEIAKLTPTERENVAWFLAQFRAKKIYEELREPLDTEPRVRCTRNEGEIS